MSPSQLQSSEVQSFALLTTYPAFRHVRWLYRRPHRHFIIVNAGSVLLFAVLLFGAAYLEKTLLLPGRAKGLLEHPGALVFLLSQCLIPPLIFISLRNFLAIPESAHGILSDELRQDLFPHYGRWTVAFIERRNNFSKVLYAVFSLIGIAAFVWNSYQNQDPMRFVGIDFWDSILHPAGYWMSRLYKFFVWVLLIPAVAHCHIGVTLAIRRLLLSAAKRRDIALEPYNPDGCGGVRLFVDPILDPLVPVVLAASMLTLSAFIVHGKYDLTTLGGLVLACLLFVFSYLSPAIALRRAILLEKDRQLTSVSDVQNKLYSGLSADRYQPGELHDLASGITALNQVAERIREIPNWPQLTRVVKVVGLAASSPIAAGLIKLVSKYAGSFVTVLKGSWG